MRLFAAQPPLHLFLVFAGDFDLDTADPDPGRTILFEAYRTKTRISQWEALLDRRFLRIHRSYIVNTERIDEWRPTRVRIGDRLIEISRKYKEEVRRRLGSEPSTKQERAQEPGVGASE